MTAISGGNSMRQTPRSGGGSTGNVTLRDLQKQYPELQISAHSLSADGSNLLNRIKPGKYHVVIDPAAIARMGKDPAFAKRMHTNLAAIKTENDRAGRAFAEANVEYLGTVTGFAGDGTMMMGSETRSTDRDGDGRPDPLQDNKNSKNSKDGKAQDKTNADSPDRDGSPIQWNAAPTAGNNGKKAFLTRLNTADGNKERLEEKRLERREEEKRLEKQRARQELRPEAPAENSAALDVNA